MAVQRDENGRFLKGVSGNPSGRTKIPKEIIEEIRNACPHAVERLISYVDNKNPKIAMWAITELLDRGYGKPAQSVNMDMNGILDVRAQIRDVLLERIHGHGDTEVGD